MPAEAVEGLAELGVGGGGVAQDREALGGQGVVDEVTSIGPPVWQVARVPLDRP